MNGMRNLSIIILLVLGVVKIHAQGYMISFAGSGDTTAIGSIKVYNLTSGDSVTLNGGDILHLKTASGIDKLGNEKNPLQIYPNPVLDKSVLAFSAAGKGNAVISVLDMSGTVLREITVFLSQGTHEFLISGLNHGMYLLKVSGPAYAYSTKLVSQGNSEGEARIEYYSGNKIQLQKGITQAKSLSSTVDMNYTGGDLLLYKSVSGQYSTIVTDIPTGDKTVTFNFVRCADANGHKYASVGIGTQTWMAQNLNAGGMILDTTNQSNNGLLEKYCYENKESNCDVYGGLYQWDEMMNYDTVPGSQGICPAGWHLPTDAEWTVLLNNLGGDSTVGANLKETGTTHWAWPNTGATNESGFTALPGGYRYYSGTLYLTDYAVFWSSSESLSAGAWYRQLYFNYAYVTRRAYTKSNGFSVRCLKN
jgi:uncharacterized protein (TIGR02145 family)